MQCLHIQNMLPSWATHHVPHSSSCELCPPRGWILYNPGLSQESRRLYPQESFQVFSMSWHLTACGLIDVCCACRMRSRNHMSIYIYIHTYMIMYTHTQYVIFICICAHMGYIAYVSALVRRSRWSDHLFSDPRHGKLAPQPHPPCHSLEQSKIHAFKVQDMQIGKASKHSKPYKYRWNKQRTTETVVLAKLCPTLHENPLQVLCT